MNSFKEFLVEAIDTTNEIRVFLETVGTGSTQLAGSLKRGIKSAMEEAYQSSNITHRDIKLEAFIERSKNNGTKYANIKDYFHLDSRIIFKYKVTLNVPEIYYEFWKNTPRGRPLIAKMLAGSVAHELLHLKQSERRGGINDGSAPKTRLKNSDASDFTKYLSYDFEIGAFAQGTAIEAYQRLQQFKLGKEQTKDLMLNFARKPNMSSKSDIDKILKDSFREYILYLDHFKNHPKILNKFKKRLYEYIQLL